MGDSSEQLNQIMSMLHDLMTQQAAHTALADRHQEAIAALAKRIDDLSTAPPHDHANSSQAPPLLRNAPPPLTIHEPPPSVLARPNAATVPRYNRLEFPTYDGKSDPLSWLTKCEQFFGHQQTPAADQIHLASFHMLDSAVLWASRLLTDRPNLIWDDFKRLCNLHFGPPIRSNPLGALTTLRQTGTIDEYMEQFQLLLAHVPLAPDMQVNIFTTGLRERLRLDVKFEPPPGLSDCYESGPAL
ncbi:hypothetical protein KSP39_PZI000207 [Platanthera zijinensis]|uniref:Retrotransposon gag domain-containing protein n=1 Tax=Platanthera zijinensis TaxID=2320716 RepID=A0AAP0GEW9_9ASPA